MQIVQCSSSFARPADTTQYGQNDLVANSTAAGSVEPLTFVIPYGSGLKIWRAGLLKSSTTATNAVFRLHLYKDKPTCANGDNGAWSTTVSGYQGFIDINNSGTTFSDDSQGWGVYVNNSVFAPMMLLADRDRTIYGLLQNTSSTGYVPTSEETFTVTLIGEAYV